MSDIDRVFAKSRSHAASPTERRQLLTVQRRGARGSRVVEVVHLHPRAGSEAVQPRSAASVGGADWGEELAARAAPVPPVFEKPAAAVAPEPVVYIRPAWEPKPVEVQRLPTVELDEPAAALENKVRKPRSTAASSRRVADPFDANDDGANCIRCGYLVDAARAKRGLMTCAGCG